MMAVMMTMTMTLFIFPDNGLYKVAWSTSHANPPGLLQPKSTASQVPTASPVPHCECLGVNYEGLRHGGGEGHRRRRLAVGHSSSLDCASCPREPWVSSSQVSMSPS